LPYAEMNAAMEFSCETRFQISPLTVDFKKISHSNYFKFRTKSCSLSSLSILKCHRSALIPHKERTHQMKILQSVIWSPLNVPLEYKLQPSSASKMPPCLHQRYQNFQKALATGTITKQQEQRL